MKIEILDVESTRNDEIISGLIGTKWDVHYQDENSAIIQICGGVRLEEGEYELIY